MNERLLSFIGSTIFNSSATKKSHIRTEAQLFPWLRRSDRYEDEIVLKARALINSMSVFTMFSPEQYQNVITDIKKRIKEEIEIQQSKVTAANIKTIRYRVRELRKLL